MVGKTIKALRDKRNITQQELAAVAGISVTYLSQIENDKKLPILSTLKAISNGLSLPLPILFFLSLEEEDISQEKREAFSLIGPSVKSYLNDLFVREEK